ncbi:MAG: hypothetical protein PHU07_01965 [Acidocella sp.]|nr:hypothetical protein [Acidocella sp.]
MGEQRMTCMQPAEPVRGMANLALRGMTLAMLACGGAAQAQTYGTSNVPMLTPSAASMDTDLGVGGMAMTMPAGHGTTPADVQGAIMVPAGKVMVGYSYMNMDMAKNYIGDSTVSPETIVTTIPSTMTMAGGKKENYRIVPSSMETQMHMLKAMYGVTDRLNLMVMGTYEQKSMRMTTFSGSMGTKVLGTSNSRVSGFGDTMVGLLWRLYQDPENHLHLNFGLSLPSGSITQTTTMLSPSGKLMTMRASYGMQLGTGTVDAEPGLTYTGQLHAWSWGAAYRGRFALDDNSEGYHYGDLNELTGWGGYSWIPGVTTTAQIDGSIQGRIHGADPLITGLMQGTNPRFYGGKQISLLGGVEIAGSRFGLKGTQLAIVAGGPVYQNLNGPQLGRSWQVGVTLGAGF